MTYLRARPATIRWLGVCLASLATVCTGHPAHADESDDELSPDRDPTTAPTGDGAPDIDIGPDLTLPSMAPRDAEEAPAPTEPPREETPEVDARLEFLTTRIATQRSHAEWWWTGFLGFYSMGLVVQATRASARGEGFLLPGNDRAERADLIYSAVKATGGVIRFAVQPYGGIEGTASFANLPERTAEDRRFKVARAEEVLAENAEATVPFGRWYAHVLNFVVNGAGVLITGLGFDDWQTGAISAGIGASVGEISFLLQPWEADDDLEDYETRFDADVDAPRPRSDDEQGIRIEPAGMGIRGTF